MLGRHCHSYHVLVAFKEMNAESKEISHDIVSGSNLHYLIDAIHILFMSSPMFPSDVLRLIPLVFTYTKLVVKLKWMTWNNIKSQIARIAVTSETSGS